MKQKINWLCYLVFIFLLLPLLYWHKSINISNRKSFKLKSALKVDWTIEDDRNEVFYQKYRRCKLNIDSRRYTLSPSNYMVDDDNHFVYFEIPKAASTAIRSALHAISLKQHDPVLERGAWNLNEEVCLLQYFLLHLKKHICFTHSTKML